MPAAGLPRVCGRQVSAPVRNLLAVAGLLRGMELDSDWVVSTFRTVSLAALFAAAVGPLASPDRALASRATASAATARAFAALSWDAQVALPGSPRQKLARCRAPQISVTAAQQLGPLFLVAGWSATATAVRLPARCRVSHRRGASQPDGADQSRGGRQPRLPGRLAVHQARAYCRVGRPDRRRVVHRGVRQRRYRSKPVLGQSPSALVAFSPVGAAQGYATISAVCSTGAILLWPHRDPNRPGHE